MQKRNFGQVKRQKETARKARQQEKQERRRARVAKLPADPTPSDQPPTESEAMP